MNFDFKSTLKNTLIRTLALGLTLSLASACAPEKRQGNSSQPANVVGATNPDPTATPNLGGTGLSSLKSFNPYSLGTQPSASLIEVSGALYGTTVQGGGSGQGTVFKISPDGSGFQMLHEFSNTDGANRGCPSFS
ncbi:MAG: hypothetical protein EBX52_09915 [Proteobacteria bacterium]|nr:hypothetical protein [Pseudomonadota bacterium]